MVTLLVAVAAGIGACTRLTVDDLLSRRRPANAVPVGTLAVNLSGSFVLGLVTGLGLHHGLDPRVVAVLGAGFAGGYTTLSTWAWETVALAGQGRPRAAAGYLAVTAAGCLLTAAAGLGLALA
jgi:CrcB protein